MAFRQVPYPPQVTGLQVQPSFMSSSPLLNWLFCSSKEGLLSVCLVTCPRRKVTFLDPTQVRWGLLLGLLNLFIASHMEFVIPGLFVKFSD